MRVLVLRPENAARRTAARLAALGHDAVCAPLLDMQATNAPAPPGAFDAVLATSAQAFRFADADALRPFLHLPMMCVGARTAQAARDAGFRDISIEAPDAARLVGRIAAQGDAGALLVYLVARDRKPVLESGLAAAGINVTPWVVYEARAAAALSDEAARVLRAGALDAALHFSPRSAAIFCDLVAAAGLEREARALVHVAISTDAARALEKLELPDVRVAAEPDEAHMLECLE